MDSRGGGGGVLCVRGKAIPQMGPARRQGLDVSAKETENGSGRIYYVDISRVDINMA